MGFQAYLQMKLGFSQHWVYMGEEIVYLLNDIFTEFVTILLLILYIVILFNLKLGYCCNCLHVWCIIVDTSMCALVSSLALSTSVACNTEFSDKMWLFIQSRNFLLLWKMKVPVFTWRPVIRPFYHEETFLVW
jgi:hypothetical protein